MSAVAATREPAPRATGITTQGGLYSLLAILVLIVWNSAASALDANAPFPRFRHIDPLPVGNPEPMSGTIRLLADPDFPPWSFRRADGVMIGISVDLARDICDDLRLTCEVVSTPFTGLLPGLEQKSGDLVISGLRLSPDIARAHSLTRPYFRSLSRFVVRRGSPLLKVDPRTLAGARLGFVKATVHSAFLERHYSRSALVGFVSQSEMLENLRIGAIDVAFGDALQLDFWLFGESSKTCCESLGAPMLDDEYLARPLVFLARRDDVKLRDVFDVGLDRMEQKGRTQVIFNRYLVRKLW